MAAGLPAELVWAGGLAGFIAGGMISFIVFKAAVILFTSLGGSALMVVGVLAIIYQYMMNGDTEKFKQFATTYPWFLPALLLVPLGIGIFLQHRFSKASQEWE